MTTKQQLDAMEAYINDTQNRLDVANQQLRKAQDVLQQMRRRLAMAEAKAAEAKAKARKAQSLTPKI